MDDWGSRISRSLTADGSVVVPPRVAAWLEKKAGMTSDRRIAIRSTDPDAYAVLAALHIAALSHRSDNGTKHVAAQSPQQQSDLWFTTTEVASLLRVTERAIRKWCAVGRLPATKIGGRWVINRNCLRIANRVD